MQHGEEFHNPVTLFIKCGVSEKRFLENIAKQISCQGQSPVILLVFRSFVTILQENVFLDARILFRFRLEQILFSFTYDLPHALMVTVPCSIPQRADQAACKMDD
jgi:hypothetical protein